MDITADTGAHTGADVALELMLARGEVEAFGRRAASGIVRARVSAALLPAFSAALWRLREDAAPRALALLVGDDDAARALAEDAGHYLPGVPVGYLPSRGAVHGSGLEPAAHLVGERHRALEVLAAGGLIAVSADALVERIPPVAEGPAPVRVSVGEEVAFDSLLEALAAAGYERTESVEERGQFSVRGGLVDVFASTGREPIRIEFFGDTVERVSAFSLFTQRSLRELAQVTLYAAAEVRSSRWGDPDAAEPPTGWQPLADRVASLAGIFAWNPDALAAEVAEAETELADRLRDARMRDAAYVPADRVQALLDGASVLEEMPLGQPESFEAQPPALASVGIAEAENELRALVRAGYRVIVAFPHLGEAERTGLALRRVEAMPPSQPGRLAEPGVQFVVSALRHGFVSPAMELAVLPAHQLFRRRAPRGPIRTGRSLATVSDLRAGDYVVHEDHGVGRFVGFDTKEVGGVVRDYLYLEFRGEDRLYVPHDQLGKVSRYVGSDGHAPALSKLGGKAWQTLKTRARVAVRELAGELLALYARRSNVTKAPIPPENEWMSRLEEGFPFEETDDQRTAIDVVFEELESEHPMDRLVCGDVGFGKTEVALRAAFKVATAGRQVLMLVPTTILAQQHAATFRDRFRDFPVRVEMVSRFRAAGEVKKVLAEYAAGKVDVLVGTHRVLSRDVVPQDLGLVVVDEEQRFGVAQKELLRQLRLEVDVLSMSATPIPRTLHMSLSGLRDITVITTPPRGRHPIKTHVGEFDPELIAAALRREHAREGQSFYLHNRVETIDEAAERVRGWVPELRVGVAHGQMTERSLERVMMQFLRGDFDVLVSTTIIESGLDIPHANTLVVERADTLGLAQLYQIRGRVGRSNAVAHAYLFYPDGRELSEEARHRLSTLADYTELGSGYRIAMRDLELRGAGNLLGDEQSGHVAAIGFELYCDLLAEAVAELQGERPQVLRPVRVEAQVDAYVPADYIPLEAVKVDLHRRVALSADRSALRELRVELADRFGPLPDPVENLISIQEARLLAAELGADQVSFKSGKLTVSPVQLSSSDVRALKESHPQALYTVARHEVSHRNIPINSSSQLPIRDALEILDAMVEIRRDHAA